MELSIKYNDLFSNLEQLIFATVFYLLIIELTNGAHLRENTGTIVGESFFQVVVKEIKSLFKNLFKEKGFYMSLVICVFYIDLYRVLASELKGSIYFMMLLITSFIVFSVQKMGLKVIYTLVKVYTNTIESPQDRLSVALTIFGTIISLVALFK